jgi:hypothetical protein
MSNETENAKLWLAERKTIENAKEIEALKIECAFLRKRLTNLAEAFKLANGGLSAEEFIIDKQMRNALDRHKTDEWIKEQERIERENEAAKKEGYILIRRGIKWE